MDSLEHQKKNKSSKIKVKELFKKKEKLNILNEPIQHVF